MGVFVLVPDVGKDWHRFDLLLGTRCRLEKGAFLSRSTDGLQRRNNLKTVLCSFLLS